jgi:hypothetical protein
MLDEEIFLASDCCSNTLHMLSLERLSHNTWLEDSPGTGISGANQGSYRDSRGRSDFIELDFTSAGDEKVLG